MLASGVGIWQFGKPLAGKCICWAQLKTAIVGQILTRSRLKLDVAILAALQRLVQIACKQMETVIFVQILDRSHFEPDRRYLQ